MERKNMKKIGVSSQLCEYTKKISGKIIWGKSSVECQILDAALNICNIEKGLAVEVSELNCLSCPQAQGQKLIL